MQYNNYTEQELISRYNIPSIYSGSLLLHGANLKVSSDLSELRFAHAMSVMNFNDVGGSQIHKVYHIIAEQLKTRKPLFTDMFIPVFVNTKTLAELGPTKSRKLVDQILNVKSIDLNKIIVMMCIDGCGWSTATEIAKDIAGLEHNYKGKQHSVVESFKDGNENRLKLDRIKAILKIQNISINLPVEEKPVDDAIYYILTGSPKSAGFKTKKVFKETLPANWVEVGKIKEANVLITDDLKSNSSKMCQARANDNIEIRTYDSL